MNQSYNPGVLPFYKKKIYLSYTDTFINIFKYMQFWTELQKMSTHNIFQW